MEDGKLISIENVTISHDSNVILENVNFSLGKNEHVFLTGRVGSGKTSLLRMLYADLTSFTGNAEVCGIDLKEIRPSRVYQLRRKLGIIFQDFQLLPDRSVRKNLEFVLKATGWKNEQFDERIIEVLRATGMNHAADKLPSQLSGGEQQKVSISRALLNEPEIILADEPTGNLDPTSTAEIFELLTGLTEQGRSVIMATHNYQMVAKYPATKIYYCRNKSLGQITLEELQTAE
jgi:cell division transport system ATP-binding protein